MFVYAALADNINGVMYSDLTGRFPVESYWGIQYIVIAYIYDENVILMRPIKIGQMHVWFQFLKISINN